MNGETSKNQGIRENPLLRIGKPKHKLDYLIEFGSITGIIRDVMTHRSTILHSRRKVTKKARIHREHEENGDEEYLILGYHDLSNKWKLEQ